MQKDPNKQLRIYKIVPSGKMLCPKCGKIMPSGRKQVCPRCGWRSA